MGRKQSSSLCLLDEMCKDATTDRHNMVQHKRKDTASTTSNGLKRIFCRLQLPLRRVEATEASLANLPSNPSVHVWRLAHQPGPSAPRPRGQMPCAERNSRAQESNSPGPPRFERSLLEVLLKSRFCLSRLSNRLEQRRAARRDHHLLSEALAGETGASSFHQKHPFSFQILPVGQ